MFVSVNVAPVELPRSLSTLTCMIFVINKQTFKLNVTSVECVFQTNFALWWHGPLTVRSGHNMDPGDPTQTALSNQGTMLSMREQVLQPAKLSY